MLEPVYSRRYSKEGDDIYEQDVETDCPESYKQLMDMPRDWRWVSLVRDKVIEVTQLNRYDVDIYESSGTLMAKIFLDILQIISELAGLLGMADAIAICTTNECHSVALSIFYDLD